MVNISVVLPTYGGDDPDALREAIESIVSQTRVPDELVIVRDGPVPETNQTIIDNFESKYSFVRHVPLAENQGRALARKVGVERCQGDVVAMMDADDLCVPTRLERQETYLQNNPEVDVVGAQLLEFDPENGEKLGVRTLPTDHEEIRDLAKTRSPVSQSTVIFKRTAALDIGNYRDVDRMEDYGLWVRMLVNGARFANIPEVLVKARTGEKMYERRAGWEYAREELRLQREFVALGFISPLQALRNVAFRVPIRFVPNAIRAYVYETLFRTEPSVGIPETSTVSVGHETDVSSDETKDR
ncbi:family 2 glycosyl transferase [Haloarcula amylolytica JCM 13557]|uniref:Family 2 glycosyl transferase n=2 Tax=Haloarculaceae TaxID=1963268 RepID=M0K553_9EURY|nr:family 2 glycosyl transferase [Haloarcula amylolytica JCM 13557]